MIKRRKMDYMRSFVAMSEYACQSADELYAMLQNYDVDHLLEHLKKMHKIENASDELRHDVVLHLAEDIRAPLDREDIVALGNALDDVVDMIEDISISLHIYNVINIEKAAISYGSILSQSCHTLHDLMEEFMNFTYSAKLRNYLKQINDLEDEGDTLFTQTTHELFAMQHDSVDVIRWKSVYDRMELTCDACEKVGHLIETILLKKR